MAGYKHLEIPCNFERFVKDKKQSANAYYRYFLTRLTRMFEYKGLPDTIPHEIMDRYLFINGIACITEVEGKLYVFYGNAGGEQDVYYRPSKFIISNPHIKKDGELFTANVQIFPTKDTMGQPSEGIQGILLRNDTDWIGLNPLLSRYSYLMAENTLTIRTADVMLRVLALLTAPSDKEEKAALEYLKNIENGNLGVIGESAFFDGVKLQSPPSNNGSYLTQFIELQQYLKGSFFNEMGLCANYNMKREAIGKGESTLDTDALLPLCEDMLLCRQQDLARVNDMYGTNIEVSFSSAWLENEIENLASLYGLAGSTQDPFAQHPFTQGSTGAAGSTQAIPSSSEEGDEQMDNKIDGEDGVTGDAGDAGAEGAEGAEESPDDAGNPESKINDMTWSDELHELEDKIIDGSTQEPTMEGGMNDDVGTEEATDDKEDVSDS